jgi:hypothetical protein
MRRSDNDLCCFSTAGVTSHHQHILDCQAVQDALPDAPHWQILAVLRPFVARIRLLEAGLSASQPLTLLPGCPAVLHHTIAITTGFGTYRTALQIVNNGPLHLG